MIDHVSSIIHQRSNTKHMMDERGVYEMCMYPASREQRTAGLLGHVQRNTNWTHIPELNCA